ncbi:hypothetical protein AVEN_66738-1 [Araneus ventricosus]|uniref:CCHC-type domain-containing protein n=1 Tax=Araneus ventricosus TaxID=182803 RepID=A0A4Y2HRL6_ARAVE|nr:hypothetical protein AVEN_66738-1 [Araneus ventricosus]
MANLEALKKSRKTDRGAFTKAYNKVEELIALEDVDISELEAELNVLKVKSDRLEITHASILELLPEKEFEVVEDFRNKVTRIETKAIRIINYQKHNYLIYSTIEGSRAREVIESFPSTGDNYPKAIDCLKTRFGRHDLQVEVYVREFLKLVQLLKFFSNNLCAIYDNLEQQIRALETLGVTTDKSAALLYPLVESCMPEDFLRAWQRSLNFHLGNDSKKGLDSLLKIFKAEVESEERINLAMTGFGLKDETSYKNGSKLNKGKMCTAASLLSTSATVEKSCVFCNGKHESTKCFKAQRMYCSEKFKILKAKGYCFKCLKAGHRVAKCRC